MKDIGVQRRREMIKKEVRIERKERGKTKRLTRRKRRMKNPGVQRRGETIRKGLKDKCERDEVIKRMRG